MATDEKGIPPSYVHVGAATPPYVPSAAPAAGYEGQQPAVAANQYPTPGPYYYPRGQPPPPAYQQQQTTGVVIVGGPTPVAQNVLVVRTVRANVQIPDVYPGPAFCLFAPGIIEIFIRSSVVVMLLVLIAVAAAAIDEESQTVYDYSYNYRYNYRYNYNDDVIVDARGWRGAAGWIIFVAGVALITEGIMLLLRFVNPKCFNNSYGVFGGLDIAKCVLVGIGLFIGCVITGIEIAVADSDLSDYCDTPFRNSDNNAACEQLERIRRIVIALTAVNVVCMTLILILFTWDIIYLSAGFNSKVPVPRGTEGQRHQ